MNLVFGHDQSVAAWAAGRYGTFQPCCRALGVVRGAGPLIGAATFHGFNGSNVELCYWGPWSITLPIARGIAKFCYDELKVNRITVRTPRHHSCLKRTLPKIGFRYEGVLRRFYGPHKRDDAIIYGLLREEAGRLLGRAAHEPR